MRIPPRRDGNPRRYFLGLFLLALLVTGGSLALLLPGRGEYLLPLLGLLLADLLFLLGLFLWLARLPEELGYELQGPWLTVRFPFGQRRVHRQEVVEVRPLAYALPGWTRRGEVAMPGYHRRRLRLEGLPVEALVGARRGEGVLLVLKEGKGLLLNPVDPRPFLAWKEEA
ncbi:hypothetical protein [Thermus sp.]|uniref:hypothetical protein n=1 Tax=Thermus sp. TaxID=275 RepID=UPI00260DA668|nr:hypothetical protein [Thermus sp.]MCX7848828.1 hypothetical protein [Thermus sp.]